MDYLPHCCLIFSYILQCFSARTASSQYLPATFSGLYETAKQMFATVKSRNNSTRRHRTHFLGALKMYVRKLCQTAWRRSQHDHLANAQQRNENLVGWDQCKKAVFCFCLINLRSKTQIKPHYFSKQGALLCLRMSRLLSLNWQTSYSFLRKSCPISKSQERLHFWRSRVKVTVGIQALDSDCRQK